MKEARAKDKFFEIEARIATPLPTSVWLMHGPRGAEQAVNIPRSSLHADDNARLSDWKGAGTVKLRVLRSMCFTKGIGPAQRIEASRNDLFGRP